MFLLIFLSAAAPLTVQDPFSVFKKACLEGSISFAGGSVAEVSAERLPGAVRSSLPKRTLGRHYRLLGTGQPAYLSTFAGSGAEQNCQVAARGLTMDGAIRAATGSRLDLPKNKSFGRLGHWSQKMLAGYELSAWLAPSKYVIVRAKTVSTESQVR